jgi:hypothetical protein
VIAALTYDRAMLGRWLAAFAPLAALACGRIGYDAQVDADVDAPIDAGIDGLPACPLGMVPTCADSRVCVDLAERGNAPWTDARDLCAVTGARLCTDAEWAEACGCAVGVIDMANDGDGASQEWEWVADESAGVAQKRGYAACGDTSTHAVTDPYDYRCCADR